MTLLQLVRKSGPPGGVSAVPNTAQSPAIDFESANQRVVTAGTQQLLRIALEAQARGFRVVRIELSDTSGRSPTPQARQMADQLRDLVVAEDLEGAEHLIDTSSVLYIQSIHLQDVHTREILYITRSGAIDLRSTAPGANEMLLLERVVGLFDR